MRFNKLLIICDNAGFGYTSVVQLYSLMSHLNNCEHNLNLEMPKNELPNYSCIKHLRSVMQLQQTRIAELQNTSVKHEHQRAEQKCDIELLKAYMHVVRSINTKLLNLKETIKYSEIWEWVSTLQPTRGLG
uniref:E3 ubiquitin-protein ligase NRDP1 domain-containing protein n=1 Tax=Meleagris gallopavo TaxID=9103 RepID=A0A803Y0H1_MELGA